MIYLYVKTHNLTGLKYLGKTTSKDPHKYPGSGLRWTRHLKKHGYDYTTEIIFESEDKEEIKQEGLKYSCLWNIEESPDWANLKPESGEGGFSKSLNLGRKRKPGATEKWKSSMTQRNVLGKNNTEKMVAARRMKDNFSSNSDPEVIQKIKESKIKNGSTLKGKKLSPETIAKRTGVKRGPYKKRS
jgi:hypothetical protein